MSPGQGGSGWRVSVSFGAGAASLALGRAVIATEERAGLAPWATDDAPPPDSQLVVASSQIAAAACVAREPQPRSLRYNVAMDASAEGDAAGRIARVRRVVPLAVLLVVTLAFIVIWSKALAPTASDVARSGAVASLEPLVRDVADRGLSQLSAPEGKALLRAVEPDAPALALFGAWAKLGLGRLRLLSATSAERLPILVPLAFGLALFAWSLLHVRGLVAAIVGGLAMVLALVAAGPDALATALGVNVAWSLLVYGTYLSSFGERRQGLGRALVAATIVAVGFALYRSLIWLPLSCLVHYELAHRRELGLAVARGLLPTPSFVLLAVPLALLATVVVNPVLWGERLPSLVSFMLAPIDAERVTAPVRARAVLLGAPLVLVLSAGAGAILLLGARVRNSSAAAAGAASPAAPPMASFAVSSCALVAILRAACTGPARAFAPPAELAWAPLALLGALGAAELASWLRVRRGPHST